MSEDAKSPVPQMPQMPQWAILVVALGGGATGLSALGLQQSDPAATEADLARLEERVVRLTDAVTELTILVKTKHPE